MSDQADGLRRLVRSRGVASTPMAIVPAKAEPPPRSKPRPGLLAAIAARWGRRSRADCSA